MQHEARRRLRWAAHVLGEVVVEHQIAIVDLEAGMHHSAILGRVAHQLLGSERLLVPIDCIRRPPVANGDVRRDPAASCVLAVFHRLASLQSRGAARIRPRFPDRWKNQWPGQQACRGDWITSRPEALQGDENAQAEDQERREEALQAHGDRQDQARGRWQAPPADQPQRQIYPSESRYRGARRRRYGAGEGLGALRPEVRRTLAWHASSAGPPPRPATRGSWSRRRAITAVARTRSESPSRPSRRPANTPIATAR